MRLGETVIVTNADQTGPQERPLAHVFLQSQGIVKPLLMKKTTF
jgi:hypothetical protein